MKTERRTFLASMGGAVALSGALSGCASAAQGYAPQAGAAPALGARSPENLTPDEALELLRQGNARFLSGELAQDMTNAQRRLQLLQTQRPFAAYVTCSDSRVPPELLFGRGLGELFIIRNAGNTVDTVALGSVEYAVAILNVPLVVVMGHESCGAVAAAVQVVTENATFPGQIGRMIEPIIPAVLQARNEPGELMDNSVRANVRRVVDYLRNQTDPIMQEPLRAGRVKVVGAYYNLESGKVDFIDLA